MALTAAFLDGLLSYFVWRCILVKSTCLLLLVMLPLCSVLYRVKGHIFGGNLVCALQATFLDGFLSIFFYRCVSQSNLYTYRFWSCCPQCSVFYRVKGHILVHILVCALTAAFHDEFLSNFVWRCIFVKSTHLLFLVMLPPVFSLL